MLERIKPIINDFVIGKGLVDSHERLVINGKLDLFANFSSLPFGHRYNIKDDRYDMDLDEYKYPICAYNYEDVDIFIKELAQIVPEEMRYIFLHRAGYSN